MTVNESPPSPHRRLGYVRRSPVGQATDGQLDGVGIDKRYEDCASAKDADRPQLRRLLDDAGEGDVLYVESLDRLARDLHDLLALVRQLTRKGVRIEFVRDHLVLGGEDRMVEMQLTMMSAFMEFERAIARERQREGIEKARGDGVYKGRQRKLNEEQVRQLKEMAGHRKIADIARHFQISRETVYQYLRPAKPKADA